MIPDRKVYLEEEFESGRDTFPPVDAGQIPPGIRDSEFEGGRKGEEVGLSALPEAAER